MAVVGIDLGTTNTVIAAVRDGRATALKDSLGRALLPSVVSMPERGEPLVGYEAKEQRSFEPKNTIFSIKRLIGRSWESEHVQKARGRFPFELKEGPGKATLVSCRGADYTLPEISALVLEQARAIAEARLGEKVSEVVITVPANFNDLQRAATKVAARVAGLEVLRILNEPTAAALAYGFGKKGRERIAVYDFGGGTFDITLLDLSENVFEVLATAGDTFLGGDDIDIAIIDLMAEELQKKHGIDAHQNLTVREQLRLAAEKLKIDLSTRSMAKARVEKLGHGTLTKQIDFEYAMKRSDFEKLAEPLVERTLEVCQEAMDIAGIGIKDLDQVLLVGGSTRIPLVRRRISSFFGKMPQSRVNPDEVVAIGAAIQATALESRAQAASIPVPPDPGAGKSSPPATSPSTFPASPQVPQRNLSRAPSNTKTGLAGLRKTLPGAGGSEPPPAVSNTSRTEGSLLSSLPKATSTRPDSPLAHNRPSHSTLTGLGDEAEEEPRGPKTLLGVGEQDANALTADADLPAPLNRLEPSRPPAATRLNTQSPGPLFKTLSGVGPEAHHAVPPPARQSPLKTLSGVGPEEDLPAAPLAANKTSPPDLKKTAPHTLAALRASSPSIHPDTPSHNQLTTNSTLARLGVSDSKLTSTSTLSGLSRLTSSPPPRTESLIPSLDEGDLEDVTSLFPAPEPTPAPEPRASAASAPTVRLKAQGHELEPPPAPEPPAAPSLAETKPERQADPFADLPATVAPPLPSSAAVTDGSVVFDFEELGDVEEDLSLEEAALPSLPVRPPSLDPLALTSRAGELRTQLDSSDEILDLPAPSVPPGPPETRKDLPSLSPLADLPLPAPRAELPSPVITHKKLTETAPERPLPPFAQARSSDELSLSAIHLDDLEASGFDAIDLAAELPSVPPPGLPEPTFNLEKPRAASSSNTARALETEEFDEFDLPSSSFDFDASLHPVPVVGNAPSLLDPPAAPKLGAPVAQLPEEEPLDPPDLEAPPDRAPQQAAPPPRPAPPPADLPQRGAQKHAPAPQSLRSALGTSAFAAPSSSEELQAQKHAHAPDAVRAPLLIDVTPLSLGIEVTGGYVDQLIERNSPIPCERTRTFVTTGSQQTLVRVRVSQGEANRFEANTILGEVELSGLPPGPPGSVKVDVTFSLDESGMLQVAARDRVTGARANAVLRLIGISQARGE